MIVLAPSRREFLHGVGAASVLAAGCSAPLQAATRFSPPIGAWTSIDNAARLAASGYDFIEEEVDRFLVPTLDEAAFEQRLAIARNAALPVRTLVRFLPANLQSVGPSADHDGIVRFAEIVFRRARRAKVEMIVFGSPRSRRVPEGFSRDTARTQLIALCTRLAPIARAHKIIVVLEPLNRTETNFINRVDEGGDIVRAVAHPNIRLLADLFHMATEDEGPDSIVRNAGLIHHTQIAEKKGRLAPGMGGQDFTGYFAALRQIGYRGPMAVECLWGDIVAEAPLAIRTIQRQLAELKGAT